MVVVGAAQAKEKAHPVDRHVGTRLRFARSVRGMSQTALADAVGITFQQVQKYESGANRVSASRLYEIGKVLDVDVAFFFEGAAGDEPAPAALEKSARLEFTAADVQILQRLKAMKNAALKRTILGLISDAGEAR